MSIKKSFGNSSIRKPGAYSRFKVDNSAGAPLESNDVLFIIGESSQGAPGSSDGIQEYNASQVNALINKYGQGPIVDAAVAAIRPSSLSTIGGAGKIMVYKTNASIQASLAVNEATDTNPLLLFKDAKYGVDGNNISITIANGTTPATQKLITIAKIGENSEILPENAGQAQISVQYTGDSATATLSIAGASKSAKVLTTALSGAQTDGSVNLSIALINLTMKQIADQINAQVGYTATLIDTARGVSRRAVDLDLVTASNIKAGAVSLYRLQEEIIAIVNENSNYCVASLNATPRVGLPVNITNELLTGGVQGASSNTDFSNAMSASLAKDINVIVPLVAQDASDDIALGSIYDGGFVTDAASAYTIASVQAALKSHLLLRSQIKTKKEAQSFVGFRDADKADCYTASETLASELIQFCFQDVQIVDAVGEVRWKQPYIQAVLAAGIRLGTDVGEPLTYKYINVVNVGHFIDMAGDESEDGDFNPAVDYDDAIDSGCLFTEKVSGGFRFVVDNTTYGSDQSFVFNRGSVIEAAIYSAKTLRNTAELVFVGKKVSNGAASSIKSILRNKLVELNEENIITSSIDAPQGFREDTFVVEVTGNTAEVQVEIKPVQGLDFFFITFTLGDIKQSA